MNPPDITYAIQLNAIKNGASVLSVSKSGAIVVFDNSRDLETSLSALGFFTTNRFDDISYYVPRNTPS